MNSWKDLLAALRSKCAYDGDGSLADVTKFIADSDGAIEIALPKGETLETLNTKGAKKVRLVVENDDAGDEDESVRKPAAEPKRKHRLVSGLEGTVPSISHRRTVERKIFDRRAAKGLTRFSTSDEAETFTAWMKTAIFPRVATDEDHDIVTKANIGTTMTAGGAFIPEEFSPTLIDLKEKYGIARQIVPVTPMSRDQLTIPKRTGGLTVYAPGEGGTITESNPTTGSVNLVSVGMKTITQASVELMNDSAIPFAEFVVGEIAQAFANKEDDCFFTGDGTASDFNVTGFTTKMLNLSATRANIAGLFVGSGNQGSDITLTDFENVLGLSPAYVDNEPGACWVCHKRVYTNIMMKLELAAGGVTAMEIKNGLRVPQFLGYPVKFSQVMPRDTASSTGLQDIVFCLFGAFNLAAKFGEVRGSMEIATSDQRYFELGNVAIRGMQRVALTVHDVGNASGTEASRVPGPVVGLLGAAS